MSYRPIVFAVFLMLGTAGPAVSFMSTAPVTGCQSSGTVGACTQDNWQSQLEKAQREGEACQADIDRFCEGVPVGEGRIEACLKAHKKRLSKKCRASQSF